MTDFKYNKVSFVLKGGKKNQKAFFFGWLAEIFFKFAFVEKFKTAYHEDL